MTVIFIVTLISSLHSFSDKAKRMEQKVGLNDEFSVNTDLMDSIANFSQSVIKDSLSIVVHDRVPMYYWDIQMIFEADDFKSDHFSHYTTYSHKQQYDKSIDGDYEGVILFVATYKDVLSAQHAFHIIKDRTQVRIEELKGQAGLLVEQVRIFERIRASGGLFTQKGRYVFYLVENCQPPPVTTNWKEYEYHFLRYVTKKNEEIEIINADCAMDAFVVEKIAAHAY